MAIDTYQLSIALAKEVQAIAIHDIVLNAAFMAVEAGKSVTMESVLTTARMEFKKLDKLVSEADFRELVVSISG